MKKFFTLCAVALTVLSANAATNWKASEGVVNKGGTLVSNDKADIVVALQNGEGVELKNDSDQPEPKTFCGETFTHYIGLRSETNASKTEPEGSINNNNITLVVTAKENVDVTVYGKNGKTKSLTCYDQGEDANVPNTQLEEGALDAGDYIWTGFVFKLQKGHTYTIYEKGGTFQLTGLSATEGTYVVPSATTYAYNNATENTTTYKDGAVLAISGNSTKTFSNGGSINGYTSIKNSNGAQMTFTAPAGKYVTKVNFVFAANKDNETAILSEINGETAEFASAAGKIHATPAVYTQTFDPQVASFTFTFSGKQANFLLEVEYTDVAPTTGLKSVAAAKLNATKAMVNGVLVIKTGNGIYNAAGLRIK